MAKKPRKPESAEMAEAAANDLLCGILASLTKVRRLEAEFEQMIEELRKAYETKLAPHRDQLRADEGALKALMKIGEAEFFASGDVCTLAAGSLIRTTGERVTIPRDALAQCKAQGFLDVIKTVESLDREAVEKWPDARLTLIGAERKPKTEFKYDLKKEATCTG